MASYWGCLVSQALSLTGSGRLGLAAEPLPPPPLVTITVTITATRITAAPGITQNSGDRPRRGDEGGEPGGGTGGWPNGPPGPG